MNIMDDEIFGTEVYGSLSGARSTVASLSVVSEAHEELYQSNLRRDKIAQQTVHVRSEHLCRSVS